jgi:hypothetical protein
MLEVEHPAAKVRKREWWFRVWNGVGKGKMSQGWLVISKPYSYFLGIESKQSGYTTHDENGTFRILDKTIEWGGYHIVCIQWVKLRFESMGIPHAACFWGLFLVAFVNQLRKAKSWQEEMSILLMLGVGNQKYYKVR